MHVVRTASVEFERTGVKDLVTGDIKQNDWNSTSETFPVYNIKEQKGYDSYVNGVKATEVAAATVNPDSSDITDTINYEVPAGHEVIAPVTQTVDYTRDVNGVAGYQDPVTGEITWNAWHAKIGKAEFASASVEQIKGYDSYVDGTKSTEVSAAAVVEKDGVPQNGVAVTITYKKSGSETPTEENFKQSIVYQDKDGNVIGTANDAITGTFTSKTPATVSSDEIKNTINNGVPKNWKITTSYKYPAAETISTKAPANIVVLVEHATKDITPTTPGVDPTNSKYKDMFKTVTRTIKYIVPEGHDVIADQTQSVSFGRDGVEDLVTGKGDWKVGTINGNKFVAGGIAEWLEFTAPTFTGYTPSQSSVAAKAVTADTPNETVTITYTQDGGGQQGGNPTPTPEPGKKPENPDDKKPTDDKKPEDKTPEKKDDTDKKVTHHKKVSHRKAKGYNHNNNTKGEQTPGYNENNGVHGEGYGDNTGVYGEGNNNIGVHGTNAANAGDKNAKTLPQTGEKQDRASIIGLALASIAGLLGFGVDRKRKHN